MFEKVNFIFCDQRYHLMKENCFRCYLPTSKAPYNYFRRKILMTVPVLNNFRIHFDAGLVR
jgi:hypothetical protein